MKDKNEPPRGQPGSARHDACNRDNGSEPLRGNASKGRVVVDFGKPEAAALALYFLPLTSTVYGPPSGGGSQWRYRCDPPPPTTEFKAPGGELIVAIRSSGPKKVVARSIHPSGEQPAWGSDQLLFGVVRLLAGATLLAIAWPEEGSRDDAACALGGLLLRSGWSVERAAFFVERVASAAKDEDAVRRESAVRRAAVKYLAGRVVRSVPKLMQLLGKATVERVVKWLSLSEEPGGRARISQVTRLAELARALGARFFHDQFGEALVSLNVDGRELSMPVNSPSFAGWLTLNHRNLRGRVPTPQAISDAIKLLEADTSFEGCE